MGKRSADGAAEAARATQKKSKGLMKAIATADAEQQARTKPEKRTRVGQREPTGGGYSRSHKWRCATLAPPCCPSSQRAASSRCGYRQTRLAPLSIRSTTVRSALPSSGSERRAASGRDAATGVRLAAARPARSAAALAAGIVPPACRWPTMGRGARAVSVLRATSSRSWKCRFTHSAEALRERVTSQSLKSKKPRGKDRAVTQFDTIRTVRTRSV
jgi:hypothetical protein